MTKVIKNFTAFMNNTIKFFLVINLIAGVGLACICGMNLSVLIFGIIAVLAAVLGYKIINIEMSSNYKLLLILIVALILRVLWLLNVDSVPASDFKTMYDSAGYFLKGDRSMFYGTAYFGRFPHLVVITLYMSFIRFLFPISNLIVMKGINVLFGIIVIILIYLNIGELYKNKDYALKGALISAIFPPFISYTGVLCSENIAIPFYLLSIYLFLLALRHEKKAQFFILSGIMLGVGNLLRTVAIVVLAAYVIYILIYYKDKVLKKIFKIGLLIMPYAIIICLVSFSLEALKITDHPLWSGSEPNVTSILKGSNYESLGVWNPQDVKLIEDNINDYQKLENLSKQIIEERFTKTSFIKLGIFYLGKFALVWSTGDCAGVLWAQKDINQDQIEFPVEEIEFISTPLSMPFQIIFLLILVLVLLGMFNRKNLKNIKEINLFYLILCGYGLTYLITEAQPRYSYIVSWIFIILSINGIEYLKFFRKSLVFYNDSL